MRRIGPEPMLPPIEYRPVTPPPIGFPLNVAGDTKFYCVNINGKLQRVFTAPYDMEVIE